MGTSKSSNPRGKTPLLPNFINLGIDAPEPETPHESLGSEDVESEVSDQNVSEIKPTPYVPSEVSATEYWKGPRSISRSTNTYLNNHNKATFKRAAKSYVGSYGGSKKATQSSFRGITVASGYASFLGSFAQSGIEQTLDNYGLSDCKGKTPQEVFARIADFIAPPGATNDEAIARNALLDAMEALFVKYLENEQTIEKLDSLDENDVKESLVEYVSSFIFYKWVYELGTKIESKDITEKQAVALEAQMKEFIHAEVQAVMKDKTLKDLDIKNGFTEETIKKIFELAYSTLEK
jgi:hypothetical protein